MDAMRNSYTVLPGILSHHMIHAHVVQTEELQMHRNIVRYNTSFTKSGAKLNYAKLLVYSRWCGGGGGGGRGGG